MINKRILISIIIVIFLIIPLIYSFTFFNRFAGQIEPTDYPKDWYEINNFLNKDKQDFKILFLPWHQYMSFDWVLNKDKSIANPSRYFFDKEVISGTNVEIGNIRRQDYSPDQVYIDFLLKNKYSITNFGKQVSILNVKYILLTKEVDYKKYFFLFNQTDLELIKETKHLYVFENKNKITKIYQTDDISHINSENIPMDYEKISPVHFKLKGELSRKYIVFTEPYSEDWELDGKKPLKAYGTVNAYENNGKDIIFERFYRINLPAYIISFLTFLGLITVYLRQQGQKK
jgi:hypothetical protein